MRGGTSPDGIHWKTLPDPLVVEYCDTWNTGLFRPGRSRVCHLHPSMVGRPSYRSAPAGHSQQLDRRRPPSDRARRRRAISGDLLASEMILEPTPDLLPSEQLYTNCHTTIPCAPDQHLMFPAIWNGSVDDTTRIALASSHDGKNWHWVPGGDLLRHPTVRPLGRRLHLGHARSPRAPGRRLGPAVSRPHLPPQIPPRPASRRHGLRRLAQGPPCRGRGRGPRASSQ